TPVIEIANSTAAAITTTGNGDALFTFGSITVRNVRHILELTGYLVHTDGSNQNMEFQLHEGPVGTPSTLVGTRTTCVPDTAGGAFPFALSLPFTRTAGTREYHLRWRCAGTGWQRMGASQPTVARIIEAPATPLPSPTPPGRTDLTLSNGWVNLGGTWETAHV